jgi:hypothetical protein
MSLRLFDVVTLGVTTRSLEMTLFGKLSFSIGPFFSIAEAFRHMLELLIIESRSSMDTLKECSNCTRTVAIPEPGDHVYNRLMGSHTYATFPKIPKLKYVVPGVRFPVERQIARQVCGALAHGSQMFQQSKANRWN